MKSTTKLKAPMMFLYAFFTLVLIDGFILDDNSALLLPKAQAKTPGSLKRLPDFSKIIDVKEKKEAFFSTLYPIIQAENNHVLQLRKLINMLKNVPVAKLSKKQQTWLLNISKSYKLESDVIDNNTFDELLKRVDYVPPSLALTQAAIESGWGSSRFSKQGNNLFGQWCFSAGCGMVPSSRDSDKGHEVAKFDTVNMSVRSYILNLNTHDSYTELRENRALLRAKEASFTGVTLAKTLTEYSEEGQHYVAKVTEFIHQNKLQRFTTEFESSLQVITD
ncbi:glucosaminidase domain-containing protein [Colwellia sp. BRX10-3]|uniref:glucosaminidase domain-containing protein n=1 Tax=Colwellia sp. BRX10-3 TaxID=2759844 RepID=UPI0015F38826|nr:glucosaminidase domain-containing protein [Colwellia sp. BRX10-3]MBA6390018.1 glucosaminidase domain-containing protein [Colwellia sp. BRX10-3]